MKKLLKFLTLLTISTPLSLNLVGCNKNNPEGRDSSLSSSAVRSSGSKNRVRQNSDNSRMLPGNDGQKQQQDIIQLIDVIKIDSEFGGQSVDKNNVLDAVLAVQKNKKIEKDDLEIANFVAADAAKNGKVIIKAKSNGKYSGQVEVVILSKNDISKFIEVTEINSVINGIVTDDKNVLARVLEANPGLAEADFEFEGFVAPDAGKNGEVIIKAKDANKYSGKVKVTIVENDISKFFNVVSIGRVNDQAVAIDSADKLIDRVLKAQTRQDLEIADFEIVGGFAPLVPGQPFQVRIKAKDDNKYHGQVEITIVENDINQFIKIKEINNWKNGDVINALNVLARVLEANPGLVEADFEIEGFVAPDAGNNGEVTIKARTNKYVGEVKVTIVENDISKLFNVVSIGIFDNLGIAATNINEFLDKVLPLQSKRNLVKDDFEVNGFVADQLGEVTIKAKPGSQYHGEVKVTIVENRIVELFKTLEIDRNFEGEIVTKDKFLDAVVAVQADPDKIDKTAIEIDGAFSALVPGRPSQVRIKAKDDGKYSGQVNITIKI